MSRTRARGNQIKHDTLTGQEVAEESLIDSKIPFTDSGFVSLNVHDAIVEARDTIALASIMFYGFLDQDITVVENKAMIMVNPILDDYEIIIDGELVIL